MKDSIGSEQQKSRGLTTIRASSSFIRKTPNGELIYSGKRVLDVPAWVVPYQGGTWWFHLKKEAIYFIGKVNGGGEIGRPIKVTSTNFNEVIPRLIVPKD